MKSRLLMWLVVALITSGGSLRTVDAQSATTLDPNSFASGQNISNAFSGVTLFSMSLVPGTVAGNPFTVWTPSYAPVYAVGDFFSSSSSSAAGWGSNSGLSCFQGCLGSQGSNFGTNLLLDFNRPVTMVSVFQTGNAFNGVDLQAFNSSNQLVGYCGATPGHAQSVGNYGCYSVINGAIQQWQVDTSVSASAISKILIGGFNNGGDEISAIRYAGAPEIDSASAASGLALLLGSLVVLRGRRGARQIRAD